MQDSSLEAPATTSESAQPSYERPRHGLLSFNQHRKLLAVNIAVIVALVVFGGVSYLLLGANKGGQTDKSKAPNFKVAKLPVNNVKPNSLLQVGTAEQLSINGQVNVGNSLVLVPTGAPTKPTAGQLYYNATTNTPYYYNGKAFVSLAPAPATSVTQGSITSAVTSLGGSTGSIGLGSGLALNGGQLGLSLQAGNGIGIDGSTITNTGVVSIVPGNANIVVTNLGNGSFSISDNIVAGITGGGTLGKLPLFSPTGQQLADSILSQASNTISDSGGLSIQGNTALTGDLSINTNKLTVQASSGDTAIAGILGVTGLGTFNGGLTVATGNLTVSQGNFDQSGSSGTFSTGTGNVSLQGNVSVANGKTLTVGTGATTLNGTLDVKHDTTLEGTLTVNTIQPVAGQQLVIGDTTGTGGGSPVFGSTNFYSNGIQFLLPSTGGGAQHICTTESGCATGAGGAVILGPTKTVLGVTTSTYQQDGSDNSIWIWNNSANANAALLRLEGGATENPAFLVDQSGNTTIDGQLALGQNGAGSTDGKIVFNNHTNTNTVTLQSGITTGNLIFTLPTQYGLDTQCLKTDHTGVLSWGDCAAGSGVTTIGTLNTDPTGANKQANGAVISGTSLILQSADANFAGLVDTNAQTFAGDKTFNGEIFASKSTGTGLSVAHDASIGGTASVDTLSVTHGATFNNGLTVASGQSLVNNGSTLLASMAIANHGSGGNIGTAAATVDVATTFDITQTTASQTLTLPNPTVTTSGRVAYINSLAGNATFSMYGVNVAAGSSASFIWNGTAWVATATGGTGVNTVGSLNVSGGGKSANGAVISGSTLSLQSADASFAGLVDINTQTFAGAKTFQDGLTVGSSGTSTANFLQQGTGTFGTGSGAVSLNGATTVTGSNTFKVNSGATTLGGTLAVTGAVPANGALAILGANSFVLGSGSAYLGINGGTGTANFLNFQAGASPATVFSVNSSGNVQVALATAANANYVCLNSSNQLAACNGASSTTGAAFIQGGNSFGAQAELGTNDSNNLAFRTANADRAILDTSGNLAFQQDSTVSTIAGKALTLQSGTGTVSLGTSTILTATGALTVQSSGSNALSLQGGSGTVNIGNVTSGSTANSSIHIADTSNTTGVQSVNIGSSANAGNTLVLEGGTATTAIQIGNGATAHGIQIGTGAAIQTITIGSTNTSSALNLQGGTGGINIGNVTNGSTANSSIHIADTTNTTGIQSVTVGSKQNNTSQTIVQGGNSNTVGAAAIRLVPNDAGGVDIGSQTGNGTISLGESANTNTVNIGSAALNASQTQTINIGTDPGGNASSAANTTIGSNTGTSSLTLQGGPSGVVFTSMTSAATASGNLLTCTNFDNSGCGSSFWTSTNWTITAHIVAQHNSGNTSALSTSELAPTIGNKYLVSYQVGGSTAAGSTLVVTLGGQTVASYTFTGDAAKDNFTDSRVITATGAGVLTFTPSTGFVGSLSGVSVSQITYNANPSLVVKNASGTVNLEVRSSASTTNSFVGLSVGQANTTGTDNTGFGSLALQGNTSGSNNTALGYQALKTNTTGSNDVAIGANALLGNTAGGGNLAIGASSLQGNTTGNNNVGLGLNALASNVAGNANIAIGANALQNSVDNNNVAIGYNALNAATSASNVAIGYQAGYTTKNSTNKTTTGANNVFIGANSGGGLSSTLSTQNQVSNSVAIGNLATVNQSNAIVLGCTSPTVANSNIQSGCSTAPSVAIGSQFAPNTLTVSAQSYGTYGANGGAAATITQGSGSGSVTVNSGTTLAAMNGGTIYYSDGTTGIVSGATNGGTTLTSSNTTGGWTSASFTIVYGGFNVKNNGTVLLQPATNTAPALNIQSDPGSTSTLLQLGSSALSSPSVAAYLGINEGSGTADFLNFQSGSSPLTVFDVSSTGQLSLGSSANTGTIVLAAGLNGGTPNNNTLTLKAASTLASPITFTLPATTGTAANQCLVNTTGTWSSSAITLAFTSCNGVSNTGAGGSSIANLDGATFTVQTAAYFGLQASSFTHSNFLEEGPNPGGGAVAANLFQLQNNSGVQTSAFCPDGSTLLLNQASNTFCTTGNGTSGTPYALTIGTGSGALAGINFGGDSQIYRSAPNVFTLGSAASSQTIQISANTNSGATGGSFTLQGGAATGKVAGGNIVLQVAPPPGATDLRNFITGLTGATSVFEDGTYLWWATPTAVGRATLNGSLYPTHIIPNYFVAQTGETYVASDGTYVYASQGTRTVDRFQISAGNTAPTFTQGTNYWHNYICASTNTTSLSNATCSGGGVNILGLAYNTSNKYLYWVDAGNNEIGDYSTILGTGAGSVKNNWFVTGVLAINPTNCNLTSFDGTPKGIAVDSTNSMIYWYSNTCNTIGQAVIPAGNATPTSYTTNWYSLAGYATGPGGSVTALATDGTNVYWSNINKDAIGYVQIANPTALNASDKFISNIGVGLGAGPAGIATSNTPGYLYWAQPAGSPGYIGRSLVLFTQPNPEITAMQISGTDGSAFFKDGADTATSFQVQNSNAVAIFNVDTLDNISSFVGQLTTSGGLTTSGLSTPAAPTVTPASPSCSGFSNYTYKITALNSKGGSTAASPANSPVSGCTNLDTSGNNNTISWTPVNGAYGYNIYRVTSTNYPAALIGTVLTSSGLLSTSFIDTGSATPAISTTAPPTADTSGQLATAGGGGLLIQDASSASIFNVTTAPTAPNFLSNSDFESRGTSGWLVKSTSTTPTTTISADSTQAVLGSLDSMKLITSTLANDGAYSFTNTPLVTGTQYTLSFYAKTGAGSITDLNAGYEVQVTNTSNATVTTTDNNCTLSATTVTTTWTRYSCTFTAAGVTQDSTHTSTTNAYINKTGTSAETYYVDSVLVQANGSATTFNGGNTIQMYGTVNTAATFQNSVDSTNAFQILNAAGTGIFDVDTANGRVGVGTLSPQAYLDIRQLANNTDTLLMRRATDSSPTGNFLRLQNAAGNTDLAKIDVSGNLTVQSATINGTLSLNGHLVTGGGAITTWSVGTSAIVGTGGTCTVTGTDTIGKIVIHTGSGSLTSAGTMCTISFVNGFSAAPQIVLGAADTNAAKCDPYAVAISSSQFTISSSYGLNIAGNGVDVTFEYFVAQ